MTYYKLNIQGENREGYVATSVFERMSCQCHLLSEFYNHKKIGGKGHVFFAIFVAVALHERPGSLRKL